MDKKLHNPNDTFLCEYDEQHLRLSADKNLHNPNNVRGVDAELERKVAYILNAELGLSVPRSSRGRYN